MSAVVECSFLKKIPMREFFTSKEEVKQQKKAKNINIFRA